jgi:transcriptional regulator with XRE-family HTH domain
MKIGSTLKELRRRKGITQDQLSDALEIKRARYNSWENDIANPDLDYLIKLSSFYKVSPNYILSYDSEINIKESDNNLNTLLSDNVNVTYNGIILSDEDKEKIKILIQTIIMK